jgi:hypothetical protein
MKNGQFAIKQIVHFLLYTKPKVVFGFGESGLHPLIRQCQALDLLNFKNLVNLHALKNPKTTFGLVYIVRYQLYINTFSFLLHIF